MKNVIVYCRVSTEGQEKDGSSLTTQERACREYALGQGYRVLEAISDTASGATLDRPGLARLRQLVRAGRADVVVAYAVDRLSRSQNHIGLLFDEVQTAAARLAFVTESFEDTAVGRFILAARSFVAEVEREKISERTLRGKAARARSGRLPQGCGKGIYGFTYDPATGRRSPHPFQAQVVQRIYGRYAETRSFSAVANELDADGISAMNGGRWYPLTVRNVLSNAAYAGRTVYRKTRRIAVRDPQTGRRHSRVEQRPVADQIEVPGATPAIIDATLWERVQHIIQDPERISRKPAGRTYLLGGRITCGLCGAAMVGQTLTVNRCPYRYYRCRRAYNRNERGCVARYVRGPELERAVMDAVTAVLSDPRVVLDELERRRTQDVDPGEIDRIEHELEVMAEREKALLRLLAEGVASEELVRDQLAGQRGKRQALDDRLVEIRPHAAFDVKLHADGIEQACAVIAQWIQQAETTHQVQVLEALQVRVVATRDAATLAGVLPAETPYNEGKERLAPIARRPVGVPFTGAPFAVRGT